MKKDFWEKYATHYHRSKKTSYQEYLYSYQLNFILNNCHERGFLLDIGCGTGILTQELSEHFHRVIGCDLSEKMLKEALRYYRKELSGKLINSDIYHLPFGDEAFMNVVCLGVFSYLEKKLQALREIVRITRSKGTIIFDVLGRYSYRRLRYKLGKYLGLRDCRVEHYHWYTSGEIYAEFSGYGKIKDLCGIKSPLLYPPFHQIPLIQKIDHRLNDRLFFPSRYLIALEVH
jgi:ubiquinone/menaquinone biosynthesis C-methylase UbiE